MELDIKDRFYTCPMPFKFLSTSKAIYNTISEGIYTFLYFKLYLPVKCHIIIHCYHVYQVLFHCFQPKQHQYNRGVHETEPNPAITVPLKHC